MSIDRRRFLQLVLSGAAAAATGPALVRSAAAAEPAPGPFGHGVASGDPLPDGIVLWTRVTPSPDATPGSGLGDPTLVQWELARDEALTDVVASGTVLTSPDTDHTVKVDVRDLEPYTTYWYRFSALGVRSPVGRTRTAPAVDQAVDAIRLGVVSCSNYQAGYFTAYRHLAQRDDLDVIVHLGDYIYEDAVDEDPAAGRDVVPEHEIVTLADYRQRHGVYKTDPDLAEAHRRFAWITTIDDHEVANDAWEGGSERHRVERDGEYAARKAAGLQAYVEWMPIRPTEETRIYRRLSYGPLADLLVLDERSYRSSQPKGLAGAILSVDPAMADPDRTMLGAEQRAWLLEELQASSAQWRIVLNSVMFTPLVVADLPDVEPVTGLLLETLGALGLRPPIVVNGDQWDGYQAEQRLLTRAFGEAGNVVLLTGDIHSSWAAEVPEDPGSYLTVVGGTSRAVEFVTPAVTSGSFSHMLNGILPGLDGLTHLVPVLLAAVGSWFTYFDGERHGFGVFEVTPEAAQYDWFYVSDRRDPEATLVPGPSWRTRAGSNRLEPTSPLGPRPLYGEPAAPPPTPTTAPSDDAPAPGEGVVLGGAISRSAPAQEPAAAGGGVLPATGTQLPLAFAALAAAAGLVTARAARIPAVARAEATDGDAEEVAP